MSTKAKRLAKRFLYASASGFAFFNKNPAMGEAMKGVIKEQKKLIDYYGEEYNDEGYEVPSEAAKILEDMRGKIRSRGYEVEPGTITRQKAEKLVDKLPYSSEERNGPVHAIAITTKGSTVIKGWFFYGWAYVG